MIPLATTGRRHRRLPVLLVALFTALLMVMPASTTGAYWTADVTGAAATAGTGSWCATPDTSGTNSRFIRLNSITTDVSGLLGPFSRKMAILPVANNAAWGGDGVSPRNLSVRLYGCQTAAELAQQNLRVVSWANPQNPVNLVWLVGGGAVAPSARLDPNNPNLLGLTLGLGPHLRDLSQADTVPTGGTVLGLGGTADEIKRYSWIIANDRTRIAPTVNPSTCTVPFAAGTCNVSIRKVVPSGTDSAAADLFDVTPWAFESLPVAGIPGEFVSYAAQTYAKQTSSAWTGSGTELNCVTASGKCTSVATPTRLDATSLPDSELLASKSGNKLQWLVIQYTGTAPANLVLEVVLG
jgi:hypothetical protein